MSQDQSKRPVPVRTVSKIKASPTKPESHPHDTRDQPPPTGRDPFPYVIAALVGLIIVGLAVTAFLVGSITSQPQVSLLPSQTDPNSNSSATSSANSGDQTATPLGQQVSVSAGTPSGTINPATGDASLPGVAVATEGQEHVPEDQAITYKSYPPTSGTHYGSTAEYGFAEQEIPEGKLVHNLEHGTVVLYYKPDLPADVLQSLRDVATKLPVEKYGKVKIVIAPYARLETPLAIAAWGRLETMQSFDYEQIRIFYEALVDHGPEDVP